MAGGRRAGTTGARPRTRRKDSAREKEARRSRKVRQVRHTAHQANGGGIAAALARSNRMMARSHRQAAAVTASGSNAGSVAGLPKHTACQTVTGCYKLNGVAVAESDVKHICVIVYLNTMLLLKHVDQLQATEL